MIEGKAAEAHVEPKAKDSLSLMVLGTRGEACSAVTVTESNLKAEVAVAVIYESKPRAVQTKFVAVEA